MAAMPGSVRQMTNPRATGPTERGLPAGRPLRIQAGTLSSLASQAAQAAATGFGHLLLPMPWQTDAADAPYLATGFDRLAPSLGCSDLDHAIKTAAEAGVALVMDVVLDRVAAGSTFAGSAGSPFAEPDPAGLLDPRQPAISAGAPARLDGVADADVLAAWWTPYLQDWHRRGIAGFRLLGLGAVPTLALAGLVSALRRALPACILLAWTPGMPREAVLGLRGWSLDGVFTSLPWWDGRADWLWDELEDLLQVAPVLGLDGVPPGPGHPVGGKRVVPGLAAMLGQGWLHVLSNQDDAPSLMTLNAAVADLPALAARVRPALPMGEAGPVLCLLRCDAAEHRTATAAVVAVMNSDAVRTLHVHGAAVLPATGGAFGGFADAGGMALEPDTSISLRPGETRLFAAASLPTPAKPPRTAYPAAQVAAASPRLAIELPSPCVDGGRFAVKAIAGERLCVQADILFDGHEKIAAALTWRRPGSETWHEAPMRHLGNDRWEGDLPLGGLGRHHYVVTAWRDRFETFRDELAKKAAAGLNVALELAEGEALVRAASSRPTADGGLDATAAALSEGDDQSDRVRLLLAPDLAVQMAAADDRPFRVQTVPIPVDAERALARFASWYEVFPRSMSDDPARHGTFADVERHLPRIRDMGFDVLYFPPISPIGRVNRKGRNNTLTPAPDDPGSPYAVGSGEGGHDALHPELGTLEEFRHLQVEAAAHGLELAIDFAIQCSPDHPWLKQHRGWFDWRPDGSIKYAENPPKKYEDIVNVDFYAEDAIPGLWMALCDVVMFWAEQGIRIFRVDNPHTKPFPFWEWMIREVRQRYPDAMFLAEAFTRPKIMYRLAKIGFSQSYTYFTWRNEKQELAEYLTELNQAPVCDFFRPHFFVNTPDINPVFLQGSGRPGFLIRAALAATLSGLFGVYCGFELCEASAVPGREEYLDSEKYQLRAWDWDRPGNITAEISQLNRIRRRNPALQTHLGVRFLPAGNDRILFFEKAVPDRSNVILVALSLDPHQAQEAQIELPLSSWTLPDDASLQMDDLVTGGTTLWRQSRHALRLTPERPYAIWRASPAA